ncbi:putative nuclease PA3 [Mycena capillaripes]|nr:putative nuclease PA3 [Mycena capillaripes]
MASYLLIGLATLQGVHAWGVLGHATVAYVAQNYVTPQTASWAKGLLNDTSANYLASIASFADQFRATAAGAWSAPLHFIDAEDNPPTTCNVNFTRDCGSTGCVVSAIANYTQRAGDGRLTVANTAEALKFLVHFVGDVTQPLHDEALALGGNNIPVTFMGFSDNIHSDWDTFMPQELIGAATLPNAQTWANTLIAEINTGAFKSQAASWIKGDTVSDALGTATRWASDANALVCTVVMPHGAAALTAMPDLFPTYYNTVIPTIELQIAKGGYRLGNWLNMVFETEVARKRGVRMQVEEVDEDERKRAGAELDGTQFLPAPQPLSRAKLARAALGYGCDHAH